jgi:hypothetical protein
VSVLIPCSIVHILISLSCLPHNTPSRDPEMAALRNGAAHHHGPERSPSQAPAFWPDQDHELAVRVTTPPAGARAIGDEHELMMSTSQSHGRSGNPADHRDRNGHPLPPADVLPLRPGPVLRVTASGSASAAREASRGSQKRADCNRCRALTTAPARPWSCPLNL